MEKSLIFEYPEIRIQHGSIRGTARLTKSSYFYRLLIFEVLFVIFFSIFILGKFRQKDYDMSYKIYQIYGLPLISILIKGELEILAINIISLLVTSGVGYFGELLTISQLENVVWISIGIILLSAILEAIFFWQNVIKINVYNHSRRK